MALLNMKELSKRLLSISCIFTFLGTHREGGNNSNSLNRFKQVHITHENCKFHCVRAMLDYVDDDYFFLARRDRVASII